MTDHRPRCRFCDAALVHTFVDLGVSPLCNTQITPAQLDAMEPFYPLHAYVCDQCFLVQVAEFVAPGDIFSEYAYFSSFSDSWVAHAKKYCELVAERFGLNPGSLVMEIASNDGYLLQHFVAIGIPVLGIEPAANVGQAAVAKGIPTVVEFFGRATAAALARDHGRPNLLLGNNVLAHVPQLNDFVAGMKLLLADDGVITMEFPHLRCLIDETQFDTIYHEHFSYFSFLTVERIFAHHGLTLFDVERLPTHGGSLRIYARHVEDATKPVDDRVHALRELEQSEGYDTLAKYVAFEDRVKAVKRELLAFLIEAKRQGKKVVGYGAPGKGNTLLNYCGIRTDFVDFTVDRNPYKQGNFTPGSRLPVRAPDDLIAARPDYVLILPWNLEAEIVEQMSEIRDWGGRFVVPIPTVRVI